MAPPRSSSAGPPRHKSAAQARGRAQAKVKRCLADTRIAFQIAHRTRVLNGELGRMRNVPGLQTARPVAYISPLLIAGVADWRV
jgi:hypothetical protein